VPLTLRELSKVSPKLPEVSYMWPVPLGATGKALTIGLTVAAPTRPDPGPSGQ